MEATGVNAAASAGDALGRGRIVEGAFGLAMMMPVGKAAKAGRSLARTEARSLAEQLTMAEAKGGAGLEIMQGQIGDPRYPQAKWAKMSHVHRTPDGKTIEVHFWRNRDTMHDHGHKFTNP
jgi:hypothetical protein